MQSYGISLSTHRASGVASVKIKELRDKSSVNYSIVCTMPERSFASMPQCEAPTLLQSQLQPDVAALTLHLVVDHQEHAGGIDLCIRQNRLLQRRSALGRKGF